MAETVSFKISVIPICGGLLLRLCLRLKRSCSPISGTQSLPAGARKDGCVPWGFLCGCTRGSGALMAEWSITG